MYKDGWWLAMRTPRIPWVLTPDALGPYAPGVWDPDTDPAELYYLPDDFTQAKDLAADHPGKVAELRELFWSEAEKYKVLPLLATLSAFFGILPPRPDSGPAEYRGDVQNVMSGMIPRIYNHSYAISADLVVPAEGAEGVIVAEADRGLPARGSQPGPAGRHAGSQESRRRSRGTPRQGAERRDRRSAAEDGRQRHVRPPGAAMIWP